MRWCSLYVIIAIVMIIVGIIIVLCSLPAWFFLTLLGIALIVAGCICIRW